MRGKHVHISIYVFLLLFCIRVVDDNRRQKKKQLFFSFLPSFSLSLLSAKEEGKREEASPSLIGARRKGNNPAVLSRPPREGASSSYNSYRGMLSHVLALSLSLSGSFSPLFHRALSRSVSNVMNGVSDRALNPPPPI